MLGLESTVSLGIQASATDPTTQARTLLNVYKITGGRTEGMPDDPILGGGLTNGSDPTLPGPGLDEHRISIEVPFCEAQFPLWLRAIFGAPAASGSNPNYIYDYNSGAATLPYCFVEHQLKSGDYRRHFGVVFDEVALELAADAEGFARVRLGGVGLSESEPQAEALPGTVTAAPALVRNPQRNAGITYNAVASVISGSVTFKRNLKRHRNADGTGKPYAVEYDGKSSVDLGLRYRYSGSSMQADAVARTARQTILELLTNSNRGLRLTLPNMRLAVTPIDVEGPDGVNVDVSGKAWQTGSAAALTFRALLAAATAPTP